MLNEIEVECSGITTSLQVAVDYGLEITDTANELAEKLDNLDIKNTSDYSDLLDIADEWEEKFDDEELRADILSDKLDTLDKNFDELHDQCSANHLVIDELLQVIHDENREYDPLLSEIVKRLTGIITI